MRSATFAFNGQGPNLCYVDLRGTKVTADGVAASKKPKLNLER